MPPASRLTDSHACPAHGGGAVSTASADTYIGYLRAARAADVIVCPGAPDAIRQGSSNVLINGREAARIGDPTVHGGALTMGEPTVLIGQTAQTRALTAAAGTGKPFCAECERLRREREAELLAEASPDATPAADEEPPAEQVPEREPENPFVTTPQEQRLAAAPGNDVAQRVAREKVVREFYFARESEGLGDERADQDLGTGGVPPRPNGHPKGFGIDLSQPVRVVPFPPPEQVAMFVRRTGAAAGVQGNFIDPSRPPGSQTGPELGLNADPDLRKQVILALPPAGGVALETRSGPIVDDWTDRDHPIATPGGGTQWTVGNGTKEESTCVRCGSPRDPSVKPHRWPRVGALRRPPRRCTCA